MNVNLRLSLFVSAAAASTLLAGTAHAQTATRSDATADPAAVGEVVVTGSRVIKDGTKAPTPVTVVTAENLQVTAQNNVADYLRALPQFQQSTSPRSLSLNYFFAGQNFVNLRGLGVNRGLVLLDGRRFVSTNSSSNVDINLFPQQLIQRVEVVTGGASAAYGADAVAGVVNFVLDKEFDGFKAEAQYGISAKGDGENYKGSFAAGGGFAGGRGRVIASVQYARSLGVLGQNDVDPEDRSFLNTPRVRVANPAVNAANPASVTNPRFIILPNVRIAQVSYTGVVASGPFANQTFRADGSLTPYNQGSNRSGLYATGGDGWNYARGISPEGASLFSNVFLRTSYEITPDITAFFEGTAGRAHGKIPNYQFMTFASLPSGVAIQRDNPYLAPTTVAAMTASNVTSLPVGYVSRYLPLRTAETFNDTRRAAVGLEGKFGKGWSWDAYYQYGESILETNQYQNTNLINFLLAADAVRNPAGQIVCRSTLTNPNNGCAPLNILGDAVPSAAAVAFINGSQINHNVSVQEVAEASLRGEPFALPAGPVAVGVGLGWRRDSAVRTTDPISYAANPLTGRPTGAWVSGNIPPFGGELSVKEAFGEVLVPLVKDLPLIAGLDLNGAIRLTDYSLSGTVTSWKVGASWRPIEDLRFRVTRSRDMRAPTITELFNPGSTSAATITDRGLSPPQTYLPQTVSSGNPTLSPEEGNTWTAGFIYQPSFVPGLSMSLDYYDVEITEAIAQVSAQQVVDLCVGGATSYCVNIDRDPVSNRITQIRPRFENLAAITTKGFDVELAYSTELSSWNSGLDGRVDLRVVGTYQPDFFNVAPGAVKINLAGGGERPDKRATFTGVYTRGPMILGVSTQWIGSQKIDPTLTDIDLANNKYKAYTYTTLSARYRLNLWDGDWEVFGVVDNVFQPKPPLNISGFSSLSYNGAVYDGVGRTYRVGFRLQY